MEKRNLLDLNQQELTELLVAEGMKKFYGKEVFLWLHKKFARNIQEMTNLSLKHREILEEKTYIPYLNLLKHQVSKIDKTEKFLFQLEDGNTIETATSRPKKYSLYFLSGGLPCQMYFLCDRTGRFRKKFTSI